MYQYSVTPISEIRLHYRIDVNLNLYPSLGLVVLEFPAIVYLRSRFGLSYVLCGVGRSDGVLKPAVWCVDLVFLDWEFVKVRWSVDNVIIIEAISFILARQRTSRVPSLH